MNLEILTRTAAELLARGKGILAADESTPTCTKRFTAVGIPSTEETRREYRELLVTTSGIEAYLSGVILYDETLRQRTSDGALFPDVLAKRGIVPGIKVDTGAKDLALHPGEKVTEGLDGLRERFEEYNARGARFSKWRAVITVGPSLPTPACIHANAHALARYSALSQEADILPIMEPEILIDGDHTMARAYDVTRDTLKNVFAAIAEQDVRVEGVILKTSMVLPGKNAPQKAAREDVAEATVTCLKESVPRNLAGIVFLSGGQSDEQATAHLNAINKIGGAPWRLTFSYARALQNPVLKLWAEKKEEQARRAFVFRARANSLASEGQYHEELEATRPY